MPCQSHLLQMRGLKLGDCLLKFGGLQVASFTDAWIETYSGGAILSHDLSHLLQMRGLKLMKGGYLKGYKSRIFYRCVD